MPHPRPFVCLLALAVLAMSAPGTAVQDPAPPVPACDASLPLLWIDGGRASRGVLDAAEREASRIWAAAGLTFDWARATPARPLRPDQVLVMVREHLPGRPHADLRVRGRHTLGRVIRVSADQPSRLIELALPAVTRSVLDQSLFGRPVHDLPPVARDVAVGRALGRVLAHEIGHWLFGREHTPHGLMRASITRRDLVAPIAPALPAAWPSLARGRLQERRRGCAPPCPVRQPVTSKGTVPCP